MSDVHPTVGPTDTLDIELEPAPHSRPVRPIGAAASVDQLQRNRARRGRLTGAQAPAPERVADRLRSESGNVAAASASASAPTAASTTSAAVRVADVAGKSGATRWKVRTSAGMVYDFPDTDSLRGWLSSRNSLDDLDVSSDGGASFTPVIGHEDFGAIQPRGYRTAAIRVPSQGLRSGNSGLISVADSGERPLERMETGSRPISSSGESGLLSTSGPSPKSTSGASPADPSPAPTKNTRKPTREERREAARAQKEAKRAAKRKAKEKAARQKEKRQRKARRRGADQSSGYGRAIGLLVLLALVAFAAVGFQRLSGPPQIPNTPAGEQFRWILSAMNGQAQVMRENEIIEHFAPSALDSVAPREILDQLRWWHERNPGYIYNGVQRGGSSASVIQAKVSTVLQDHGLITVRVEENPPHRIVDFTINAVADQPTVPNFDDL